MTAFDPASITDPALASEFRHIALRASTIAKALQTAYGQDRKPIEFRYVNEYEFNASAGMAEPAYAIEMNVAVPLLTILLFSRVLADPDVLPHLDPVQPQTDEPPIPFIVDPADFDRRAEWRIASNGIRAFAASTIADLCSTFVLCHEFGHVVLGHVEGMRHYHGEDSLAEFVAVVRLARAEDERRRAWEYDADRIAVALLIQFVEELVANRDDHPRTNLVFSDDDGFHFEHTLAIAVAALFAFFTYVQGVRTQLGKQSSHPHPYVRATYLKRMLLQAACDRRTIDVDAFHARMDLRIVEMMGVLEELGLLDARTYTGRYIRRVDRELDRLQALSERHRQSCAAWAWPIA